MPDPQPPDAVPEPARPSRRTAWLAMGAVLAALLLLMLIPESTPVDPDAPPPRRGRRKPAMDALRGKDAPLHFTLKDMNGVDVKLASFKGKVILLNFWATWCGPCKAEIPVARGAADAIPRRSRGARASRWTTRRQDEAVRRPRYKINYPLLVGNGREDVQDAYGPLWGIPVSVIIDRDGKIAKKHSGHCNEGTVRAGDQAAAVV